MSQSPFENTYRRASPIWRERLRDFRGAHALQTQTAAGQRWSFFTGGQGQRLALLLHGSESDAESLFGAMSLLERDYSTLAPTYPESAETIEQVCAGLAALIETAGRGPALVIGYSLGGYLAQALAARRPDLVARLALCNTGGPARSALRMAQAQYGLFTVAPAPLLRTALRAGARLPLWREAPDLAGPDLTFWRAYLAEMATRLSKRAILAHGRLTAEFLRSRLAPPASLATMPGHTLILDATCDHTIEPEERAALDTLYPAATRRRLPVRGHLSMLTQPEAFVAALAQEFARFPALPADSAWRGEGSAERILASACGASQEQPISRRSASR